VHGLASVSPFAGIFVLALVFLTLAAPALGSLLRDTRTPIHHVVIIMMENHSFDNIFGVYPEVNSSANSVASQLTRPVNLVGTRLLSDLSAVPAGSYSTPNPLEGYLAYHADWNHGKMNGFIYGSGAQSMTYFTSTQLSLEWSLAEEYGLGDMYFSSYLSETAPNRLMSIAGFTPVENDYGPPPYIPYQETIFGELSSYGVTWGYYTPGYTGGVPYPLEYISGMAKHTGHLGRIGTFESLLSTTGLPAVSWVMPLGSTSTDYSQHPPQNVTVGELWLLGVVDAVMRSRYWNSTAIFITYDEGGGYYDQVPPPMLHGVQLGFRVPLIVISPFSKENYVSHTVLNHASLLAFIDYNWLLPALNSFVLESNLPLDFFDFSPFSPGVPVARPPLVLSNSTVFPAKLQLPLDQLTYQRTGSSSITLASLGYALYLTTDVSYTPFFETSVFVTAITLLAVASSAALAVRSWRLRKVRVNGG